MTHDEIDRLIDALDRYQDARAQRERHATLIDGNYAKALNDEYEAREELVETMRPIVMGGPR
jgi:hypothetical protein